MKENYYNCIYIYINKINGHTYVGKAKNFNIRYKQHITSSQNKKIKDYNYPIHNAIRKYGIENFEIKILAENIPEEKIDDYEKFFIKRYKSLRTQNGYNIADGGQGGNNFSGKTEEEMEEIRQKQSEANKGENNPFYGKHLSEEHRNNLSKSHKGQTAWNKGKEISNYHKQKISESHKGKSLSEEHRKNIGKGNKGKNKNFGSDNHRSKKIDQYDLDGNLIKIWDYMKQIEEIEGICRTSVSACCRGKIKTVKSKKDNKKYIFKYHKESK